LHLLYILTELKGWYERSVKRTAMKIVRAVLNNELQKNKLYSINKFVRLAGLNSRNTFTRYIEDENIIHFNDVLSNISKNYNISLKITCHPLVKYGIKLEGCKFGLLGLVSYPILPKFVSHLRNRPRVIPSLGQYVFARPQIFIISRPFKDKISRWLLSQLVNDRDE